MMRKAALSFGLLTLACSSGDITSPVDTTITSTNTNTPASVEITPPTSATITVGTSISLSAVVKNPAGKPVNAAVTWSTSDATVASISQAGVLTAVKPGTATITGSVSKLTATLVITVIPVPVKSVSVSVKGALIVGDVAAATATALDAGGNTLTGRAVAWTTSSATVATVSATGSVVAVTPGTAIITATIDGVQGSASVTVSPAPILIATITVTVNDPTVFAVGTTTNATAVVKDGKGNVLTDRVITWTSSNQDVATITQGGLITAQAVGTTTITASSEGKSGSATFTVSPSLNNPVANVALSAGGPLYPTRTLQVVATLTDAQNTVLSGRVIVWTSTNTGVATVSQTGLVSALSVGTTTISAVSEGKTGTILLTVLAPPLTTITVTAPNSTLQPAQTTQATATLRDINGTVMTGLPIAWSSTSTAVATVSNTGLVTAVGSGTTQITVTSGTVTGTLAVTVPPVNTVNVGLPNPTRQPGQTTQATVQLLDASNNPATNRVVVWSSSNTAVATVSASGLVTAVASGTSQITVTSEGKTGSATVTIPPVNTVNLTATTTFLVAAQTQQIAVSLLDASNNPATNRVVTWSSGNPAAVTVNASGLVTAVATGTSVITATSEGKTGTITITVVPPVGSVQVTSPAASLLNGQTAQLTVLILDTFGNPVTTIPPVWATSDATKGTVTQSGLVPAVNTSTLGNVTFTATAGGVTSPPATIQIIGHGNETLATLPQVFLNTAPPPAPDVGGTIISVSTAAQFTAALTSATYGDVIELQSNTIFVGNFTLPAKGANNGKWITIRPQTTGGSTTLPAPGSRMTASQAATANLPVVQTPNNGGAILTALSAHHWRIIGLEVTVTPGNTSGPSALLRLGDGGGGGQTSLSVTANNLVIDRCYIHGVAGTPGVVPDVRRGVALNSASTAIIDSYISEIHSNGTDAQAIAGWNGPGPFKIVNNYLESSTENVSFGGADPDAPNLVPSDIEIRHNHFFKQTSWKGVWLVKNLFETKNAQRVLVEGNLMQNNWLDGQGGSFINLKSTNQSGGCTWCGTQDVTFRYNMIQNTGSGFAISADPDPNLTLFPLQRVTIHDNVVANVDVAPTFTGDGRGVLINQDVRDVTIRHNTIINPTNSAVLFGGPQSTPPLRLVIRDNIIGGGAFGVKGPGLTSGTVSINAFMPEGFWFANGIILSSSVGYPTGGFYPATVGAVNFANVAAFDFTLLGSSPLKAKGSDGLDLGADTATINTLLVNVIVP